METLALLILAVGLYVAILVMLMWALEDEDNDH